MWSTFVRPLKSGVLLPVTAAHHAAHAASTTSAQLGRIFGGHGRLWASRQARWLSCVPGRAEGANRFGNTWADAHHGRRSRWRFSHRLEQLPLSTLRQFFSSSTTSSSLGLRGFGATRSTPATFAAEHLRFTSRAAASSPRWGTVHDNNMGKETTLKLG